jgi:hypothetical protein
MSTVAVYRKLDGTIVRYELVQVTNDHHYHQQLLRVNGHLVQEPPSNQVFIKWESERD